MPKVDEVATVVPSAVKLSPVQVRILQALARNSSGLTRGQIMAKAQATALLSGPLGPTPRGATSTQEIRRQLDESDEKHGYPSLYSLGFVRVDQVEERGKLTDLWTLTEKGKEASGEYGTKKLRKKDNNIPKSVLVSAALKFKVLRTYSQERYTDDDLKEIRDSLNGDYSHVPLDDIRQQLANLRKTGALKENREETYPEWYTEYREGEYFKDLEKRVLAQWNHSCSINETHKGDKADLRVCHNSFSRLGDERIKDCIVLCRQCRDRVRKSLAEVPESVPSE